MSESDCLFCKIDKGEIPSTKVYEDEGVFAFNDINPQAPTHILICPKKHIDRVAHADDSDSELMGKLVTVAKNLAAQNQFTDYRLVFNNGAEAGQAVFHVHLHLLAGRKFTWPPG